MASIEVSAQDVESAIAQGLAQLDMLRADVKIEILEEGAKGVLGLGAKQARVRLTPFAELANSGAAAAKSRTAAAEDDDDADDFDDAYDDEDADAEDDTDADEDIDNADADADTDGAPVIEGEGLAVEITRNIVEMMGYRRAEVTGTSLLPMDDSDQPSILVDIDVEERDEDIFLTHGAEVLNALQLVVQTMWSHQTKSNVRVNVDVNGYKARKQEKLATMANRMAERVIESGKPLTLEPMNGADRRIVHMTLRDHPQVFTESAGEGAGRKVTIKLRA
jgi:spoIIIJ-associated protein